MKLRLRRSHVAVVIGLLAIVSAAALVSSGFAGSATVTFTGATLPETLKMGNQGSVKGEVTAPKGITHGVLTIKFPDDLQPSNSNPPANPPVPFSCNGCSQSHDLVSHKYVFTFDFSLPAGRTLAAFVTYWAVEGLTSATSHQVDFSLAWDNGKPGGGPGGNDGPIPDTKYVTIVGAGEPNADGKCSNLSGSQTDSVLTLQDVNNTNKQSTKVEFGAAAPSPLGYTFPCTGVFVLEKVPFPGTEGRSERSVFNGPKFATPANLTVQFYGYTKALTLTVYTNPDDPTTGTLVKNCPLASGQKVCLVGWQKVANVMIATLLYAGGDPGLDGI